MGWLVVFVFALLSPLSIALTATFMATGFATVYVMRHVVGG